MDNSQTALPGRVLMLITTLAVGGGAEAQVVRIAAELKARHIDVCVVCLVSPSAYVDQLEQQHIEVHSLSMKPGLPDLRAILRLRTIIRAFRPDIVHCHMYHANLLGRIARTICQMPTLICTVHSTRESSNSGGPTWHRELLYRATDRLADRTTTICTAALDRHVRVGAVPRHKMQLIPNGVDTDVFSPSAERRKRARSALGVGSQFVWLAVGRLVQQKDYPGLLCALELLRRKDFITLIAGAGPLERELRDDCARRGLGKTVQFCGVREDIIELYNAADAFVMSSQCEGMPLALLEAAAVGLPAIVTDVGGNSDLVINDVTGYLVPPKAPGRLAEALRRLMDAPSERREEMGRAARQHCYDQYRIATIVDQWIALYATCHQTTQRNRTERSVMTASEV